MHVTRTTTLLCMAEQELKRCRFDHIPLKKKYTTIECLSLFNKKRRDGEIQTKMKKSRNGEKKERKKIVITNA